MLAQLTAHPFQRFELERLPSWRGMEFRDEHNVFFEERTRELEAAFQHAIERNALFGFLRVYARVSREMFRRAPDRALFHEILANALPRLIRYFYGSTRIRVGLFSHYWHVTERRYRVFHRSELLSERERR